MSENDFSDNDLDVESACSPTASFTQNDDSKRHARAQHNALERRRRDNIKDMYSSLREEMPNFSESDRASRAQILKKTIELIQESKANVSDLEASNQKVQEANDKLRQQIAEKEAALKASLPNHSTSQQ